MSRKDSIEAIRAGAQAQIVVPEFGGACFSELPNLVRSLLTGTESAMPGSALGDLPTRFDRVVFLLLDGFGWSLMERFADAPLLRRADTGGAITKLTTQFPSTTAAHVTTIHTGRSVGDSGVFEWFYYEPLLDAIYAPLLHATLGRDALVPVQGMDLSRLYPSRTLYQDLVEAGVTATCSQSAVYASSPFSTAVTQRSHARPFRTLPEAMVRLAEAAQTLARPAYHFAYFDCIDAVSHRYGPSSDATGAEIQSLLWMIDAILVPRLERVPGRTLLLISADHGQLDVDPEATIYLDELLPESPRWMKTSADGLPLVPAGGPRDMFLYIAPEHLDEAQGALRHALGDRAEVHRTKALVDRGLFGREPSPRLLDRLGDLTVLPAPHEMVWWRGDGRFTEHKRGHHGGLTSLEMEIPLVALPLGG